MDTIFGTFDSGEIRIEGQTVSDENGRLHVAYEGEIHNSGEVSEEIGYEFKGKTDLELIIHAYRRWGEDFIRRLNGAFSLCIYDVERGVLLLSRDQVGRKPLYYSNYNGRFAFSSHIKPILELSWFSREIDLRALNFYTAYRYIPEALSIFKHIEKLPAGCILRFNLRSKEIKIWRYWDVPRVESKAVDEDEVLEKLEGIVRSAITIRMRGKDSLGTFLSGGLDSSLIVALMSGLSSRPIKTFSVGYDDADYNEIPFSRAISDYFGTDHSEFVIKPDMDAFIDAASLFDEPLADPSIIPTFFAVKLAKGHVDAVISGDGADGLFLGFKTHYLSAKYGRIKRLMVPPINWIFGAVAGVVPEEARWRIFLEDITPEEFFLRRNTVFGANLRKRLFKDWVLEGIKDSFYQPEIYGASIMDSYSGSICGKMGFFTFRSDADDILFKIDRISRGFSLKVRTPFLDTRLVEFALGEVPGRMKIKDGVRKYILKRLAKKFLPPGFPLERKRGFNPPLSSWLGKEWWNRARDILMDGEETFFRKSYLEGLLKRHRNPMFDEGRRIFCLLVFRVWEEGYLNGKRL
ncbi:MAG TPA: asparagine synthase (glutamine-hydrolyzing) [Thermodesulfobacteriota bacterium]|nr:asparagine synthase (glutamine-hydrolyzing) [Thermodesulfobacteriota bacterium]